MLIVYNAVDVEKKTFSRENFILYLLEISNTKITIKNESDFKSLKSRLGPIFFKEIEILLEMEKKHTRKDIYGGTLRLTENELKKRYKYFYSDCVDKLAFGMRQSGKHVDKFNRNILIAQKKGIEQWENLWSKERIKNGNPYEPTSYTTRKKLKEGLECYLKNLKFRRFRRRYENPSKCRC